MNELEGAVTINVRVHTSGIPLYGYRRLYPISRYLYITGIVLIRTVCRRIGNKLGGYVYVGTVIENRVE